MAEIGLLGYWAANYSGNESTGGLTYTNGKKIAKAINLTQTLATSTTDLYADNGLDDSMTVITGGDLSFTPNDISEEELYPLLGIKEEEIIIGGESKTLYATGPATEGSEVGFAYIKELRKSGVGRYRVVVIPRVKFNAPDNVTATTKNNAIQFVTPEIKGKILKDAAGFYVYETVTDTEREAIQSIEGFFGMMSADMP